MASTEDLPGTKPVQPAEPSAAEEDTEAHGWTNDNETVVDDKDTEGHRLSANDDETVVDDKDTEGHRLSANDDETVVDDKDTEGHRLSANDDETVVEDSRV